MTKLMVAVIALLAVAIGIPYQVTATQSFSGRTVPKPDECGISPKAVLSSTPVLPDRATPSTSDLNNGAAIEVANPVVEAAVAQSVREWVACVNAGDDARRFALATDRWLTTIGVDLDQLNGAPRSVQQTDWVAMLGVDFVQLLADGRVGAVVVFDDPRAPSPGEASYWMFAFSGGRWRLDDVPAEAQSPVATGPSSGTPSPGSAGSPLGADIPSPDECQVSPRTAEQIIELGREGTGSSGSGNGGGSRSFLPDTPADDRTVEAITATARELTACWNAGDDLRRFALWTDGVVSREKVTSGQLRRKPQPLSPDERQAFYGVTAVRRFADGRVGAALIVDDPSAPAPIETYYAVFAEDDGRWRIDAVLDPYVTEITFE